MDKRAFYGQPHIASGYEQLRFGGASGSRVNQRELAVVASLLMAEGLVLDLGCGTGRVGRALSQLGYRVVELDSSAAMLASARRGATQPCVQADGFKLPFPAGAFDAVVTLRVAFHFEQLRPLLAEAARVLPPGGSLIFDTYRWSPRALWAMGRRQWGGRVYVHSDEDVHSALDASGLAARSERLCFLCSPYLYRRLPLPVVALLERCEAYVPERVLARTFWLTERVGEPVVLPRAA